MGKFQDLTGMTFGRLKVIKRVEDYITPSGYKLIQWLCECSCEDHTLVKVAGQSLKNGDTKSCGCIKREPKRKDKVQVKEDLTGRVFGRLTVLEQTSDYVEPNSGIHHARWLCKCSCNDNNIVAVRGHDLLKQNGTKSCGCIAHEKSRDRNKKCNEVKLNLEDDHGLYGIGYCSNTHREFYFDMDDYDKIKDYCWREHIIHDGYHALEAYDKDTKNIIRMHWLFVDKMYDHKDRNPLNNRRHNLRPATAQENARNHNKQKNNTSGVIGVSWKKSAGVWIAGITINKKKIYLGSSIDKEKVIKMRLQAEAKYYGEFAPQQHLFEQYSINYLTIQN